ncbi:hypothetical protein C8Q76DRAFT_741487 [Earliella scabrosa]|nr:hypothetical protein C8Q76DRAFT_741487 [Earliella scabrosa]
MTLSDGTSLLPLPDLAAVTSTIAQRRGIKQLPPLRPRKRSTSDMTSSLSPRSPVTLDTAAEFKQRVVGFIRLSSRPDPELDASISREYDEDPFGQNSPSFFDDAAMLDVPPVHHSQLDDLRIYTNPPPSDGSHYTTEKCWEHGKAKIYIGVSDILGSASDSPTPTGASGTRHRRTRTSSTVRPPTSSTKPLLAKPATRASTAPPSGVKSKSPYRPLQLPQKVAQQEIKRAQAESILSPTTPQHRPLYLPQLIAQRASRPSRPLTPSRSNTFPFGGRNSVRRHDDIITGTGHTSTSSEKLQLDGIISLLGESGVLVESPDDSMIATSGSGSQSGDEDLPVIGAGPILVLTGTKDVLALGLADSPDLGAQPVSEPVSRKVEDILDLMVAPPVASQLSSESLAQRDVCAFAL